MYTQIIKTEGDSYVHTVKHTCVHKQAHIYGKTDTQPHVEIQDLAQYLTLGRRNPRVLSNLQNKVQILWISFLLGLFFTILSSQLV